MQIRVERGDITEQAVDAIVNPANSRGIMGGGVAGAIARKGGREIEREAVALAPVAVGAAIVTGAGTLKAGHVIHAPTMEEPGERIGIENVRRATRAALVAASAKGFATIAMPGMGTGIGGITHTEAARAMLSELRAHRGENPATVIIVDLREDLLEALYEMLRGGI